MANARADFESGEGARRGGRSGRGRTFTETRAGFKTTEFVMMLAVVVAILIATYVADADLGGNEGWRENSGGRVGAWPGDGPPVRGEHPADRRLGGYPNPRRPIRP